MKHTEQIPNDPPQVGAKSTTTSDHPSILMATHRMTTCSNIWDQTGPNIMLTYLGLILNVDVETLWQYIYGIVFICYSINILSYHCPCHYHDHYECVKLFPQCVSQLWTQKIANE